MRRSFSMMLAWRYLNPRRAMISWINLISLLGVIVGVMVLVVVLAVMAGLERDIKSRLLGFTPHILLEFDPLGTGSVPAAGWREIVDLTKRVEGVAAATPHLQDNVILDHMGYQDAVVFRAIDTADPAQVQGIEAMLDRDNYPGSTADMGLDNRAVVSSVVAEKFHCGVGDKILLNSTRNFREVNAVWKTTDRPPVREEFADRLAAAEKMLDEAWKAPAGGREQAPTARVDEVRELLRGVFEQPIRQPERDVIEGMLIVLEGGEPDAAAGVVRFAEGSARTLREALKELRGSDVEKMDAEILKGLKQIVLPKEVEVVGVYQASQHVLTPSVFVPLPLGQELTGLDDAVQGVALRVTDPYKVGVDRQRVAAVLPEGWRTVTWIEQWQDWFSLIARERVMMYFALSFIVLVSAFSMAAVMFTMTIQKRQEIGVMKALGATGGQISGVFLCQGMVIGAAGAVLGILAGRTMIHFRESIHWFMREVLHFDPFPASFHGFKEIPAYMRWPEHCWIALAAFLLCALAALVPSIPAARSDAAKSLRNL